MISELFWWDVDVLFLIKGGIRILSLGICIFVSVFVGGRFIGLGW